MLEQTTIDEQVHADDRRGLEAPVLVEQARGFVGRNGEHDRIRLDLVQVGNARVRPQVRARLLEGSSSRPSVHVSEGRRRQHQVARAAAGAHRCEHGEDSRSRVGLVGAEVERRPDEDVPEAVDRRLRLAMPAQEVAERLSTGCKPRQPGNERGDAEPVAQGEVSVAQQRAEAVADRRHAAVLVDHGQVERDADDRTRAPDPIEKGEVVLEAAECDVLPVVRRWIRIALTARQRLHLAAEGRTCLEDDDLLTCVDELERGAEPGEPAADDGHPHRRKPPPTIRSLVSAERCGGPAKTSKSRASIRSSVAR